MLSVQIDDNPPETIMLTLGDSPENDDSETIGSYSIRLSGTQPYPVSTQPIEPDDYRILFVVSRED